MIVGGYTMDLYCRYDATSSGDEAGAVEHPYSYLPHQFNGQTYTECKRLAQKRGWTFQSDGDATCPRCKKATLP